MVQVVGEAVVVIEQQQHRSCDAGQPAARLARRPAKPGAVGGVKGKARSRPRLAGARWRASGACVQTGLHHDMPADRIRSRIRLSVPAYVALVSIVRAVAAQSTIHGARSSGCARRMQIRAGVSPMRLSAMMVRPPVRPGPAIAGRERKRLTAWSDDVDRSRRRGAWSTQAAPLADRAPLQCGAGPARRGRADGRASGCCGRRPDDRGVDHARRCGSAACRWPSRASSGRDEAFRDGLVRGRPRRAWRSSAKGRMPGRLGLAEPADRAAAAAGPDRPDHAGDRGAERPASGERRGGRRSRSSGRPRREGAVGGGGDRAAAADRGRDRRVADRPSTMVAQLLPPRDAPACGAGPGTPTWLRNAVAPPRSTIGRRSRS